MSGAPAHRQRGAVAIFAAIAVLAGLLALALSIDVGRLYNAQRDLQRVANLAALDASRVAGGCMGTPENPEQAAFSAVTQSVFRNGGEKARIAPERVELGREFRSADGLRFFDAARPGETNQAVHVVLKRPAPARLLPIGGATRDLVASASASSRPYALVSVGSRVAELSPPSLNRFLGNAFGAAPLTISALGYSSLFDATVPLDALIDSTGDTTDSSRLTRRIPVEGLLHNLANALTAQGNAAAAAAAQQMSDAASSAREVLPSDLVAIAQDAAGVIGDTSVGAGELTMSTAQSARDNGLSYAFSLPPPLGDTTVSVHVLDPGQQAQLTPGDVGGDQPDYASAAQGLVQVRVGLKSDALNTDIQIPMWVEVAQATARVTDIQCARSSQPYDVVTVDGQANVSRVGIGAFDDLDGPDPQPQSASLVDADFPSGIPGLSIPVHVRVMAFGISDIPSSEQTLQFTGPFPAPSQSLGGPSALALHDALVNLPSQLTLKVEVTVLGDALSLGPTVTSAIAGLQSSLQGALSAEVSDAALDIGDRILSDASSGAGLTVGGADIRVYGVAGKDPYLFSH